mmetsp:Transcript_30364/g.57418  ORF Transcript_30364/g.57418 Transcript_30364/m.57418 type:complete len:121 (-) Transcript_30364:3229-3591(-)
MSFSPSLSFREFETRSECPVMRRWINVSPRSVPGTSLIVVGNYGRWARSDGGCNYGNGLGSVATAAVKLMGWCQKEGKFGIIAKKIGTSVGRAQLTSGTRKTTMQLPSDTASKTSDSFQS